MIQNPYINPPEEPRLSRERTNAYPRSKTRFSREIQNGSRSTNTPEWLERIKSLGYEVDEKYPELSFYQLQESGTTVLVSVLGVIREAEIISVWRDKLHLRFLNEFLIAVIPAKRIVDLRNAPFKRRDIEWSDILEAWEQQLVRHLDGAPLTALEDHPSRVRHVQPPYDIWVKPLSVTERTTAAEMPSPETVIGFHADGTIYLSDGTKQHFLDIEIVRVVIHPRKP